MSYILDALRKADADRERDPARGIHAHPVAMGVEQGNASPPRMWMGMAGAAVIVLAAVWLWPSRQPSVTMIQPVLMPAPAIAAPAPALLPPPPPPEPVARVAVAKPVPATAPAAAPASASDRILSVSELPADVLRDLPKLPISGAVYSDNPAQRMLIVNGQVANEGAQIAPGLVLEQIRPKSAVLRFRGLRYSVGY